MIKINFLHISDLHLGDKNQQGLISQTKKILFEDIEFIISQMESLDIVFFTGDLVQKGAKTEFDLVEDFLIDLWEIFDKQGQKPYLFCVPGNHDLERLEDLKNPIQKVFSNWVDEDIKDEYFWKKPNDYHTFIIKRFKNYTDWYKNTSIKKTKIVEGYLPGDFNCSFDIKGIKLGIVGLNSTFLQLFGGDAKQKLGIYNKQIQLMFKEGYSEWLGANDLSILLTHQSPEWFEPRSILEFNQEIYAHDNFVEHLCGHMHEPAFNSTAINGFPAKRYSITPSLFGLEYYESKTKRIHGYTAGSYNIESNKIIKTVWPRISLNTKSGLKLAQNEEFNLLKGHAYYTEILRDSTVGTSTYGVDNETKKITELTQKGGNLFDKDNNKEISLVRSVYKENESHNSIRHHERDQAIDSLDNKNYCWIVTEFGFGENEFIASIIKNSQIDHENCFSINCDEITTKDGLIESFKATFSLNITRFFEIVNSLNFPVLVLNHINPILVDSISVLKQFLETIFDFSPKTKIILVSNTPPETQFFESITLYPLDVHAVKNFIEGSQELQTSFTFLEYEKIHRISSGIPIYLDKVIEQLKFRPLSDLGDMEFSSSSKENEEIVLSKTLINEINQLRLDDSKEGNRRYLLLSILSLLHNGETFERIRRFNSNIPFYPHDITFLLKNKFIETIQVNSIFDNNTSDTDQIRIIRVPRVIRDFIFSSIENTEKMEIYKNACDLYLGKNWRDSIKLVQTKDTELNLIVHQNLQIAIRFILSHGIESDNHIEIGRMIRISAALVSYFSKRGAYKDAVSLAEETLLLIKDVNVTGVDDKRVYLMRKLGENLRMTSIYDRSLEILKTICDDESNSLSKKDRNDIRLSICYAYETLDKKEDAIKYANQIKQNEKNRQSSVYLSAESVIAGFIDDSEERIKKLIIIKNKADKLGFKTLKANIILELCSNSIDENNLKLLDQIIEESKNDTYNKVRAFVAKADIILNNKDITAISENDLIGLNISYTYSFYQRLSALLSKCHKLAWKYWKNQHRFDKLLNLFRYSSFVWRLCDELNTERKYIDELYNDIEFRAWFRSNRNDINSTYYEQRIFSLYSSTNLLN